MNTTAATAIPTPAGTAGPGLGALMQTPLARLTLLLLLWLLLRIPLSMIEGLVHERQARRTSAGEEVAAKWGGPQQLTGPILRVPYIERSTDAEGKLHYRRRAAYLLPEQLQIDATLTTQERRRGIFSFPVYGANLTLTGNFRRPDLESWIGRNSEPLWQQASLQVGLSDVRAIHADGHLTWAGQTHALQPSLGAGSDAAGIHIPLAPAAGATDPFGAHGTADFQLTMQFNGSRELLMAPVGKNTSAKLRADWNAPSFQGAWLPIRSMMSDQHFDAEWFISHLGRGYPQHWNSEGNLKLDAIEASLFGVTLLTPVDAYRMAERTTKYAILAAFFTFTTIWLTEILSRHRVHPLQYLLVGSALCLFGLLQLSIGEHFGFEAGFGIATLAITTLVTCYARSALGRWSRALLVGGLLGGLYGYLYLLLKADDYALLGGSIALFAGLAVVMLLTRKLDWHRVGSGAGP